ncbi:uncharacterized protein BJ212DRAFT_1264066 [Suillus subaureus]|uniref:DUF202 domain-containing protein n=1 Tax=Suillus subaureus TaxID=48587 RepID=A0A9P7JHG9_9AGAM|nr:uncharacterized protein BJ212DRAFT_1264066 [Suillus subaureus]KAG1822628.1 hypothetical protein BJ212DRAFT_1264066 [Suillus subaureus]
MLNSVNASEPVPSAGSQAHISSQITCKQSSPRKFREVINEVTAPLTLSLVLENKGNVARDHLASERTYLAYVRTSLACASAGVALVQLFTLSSSTNAHIHDQGRIDPQRFARPLGATVVLLGLFILVYGESYSLVRYFMTQAALLRGFFPVARNSIAAVAFALGAVVGIVFGVLVAGT